MNGLQAYRYYMAVKLHFTRDSFDVFTNPNVKCNSSTFEKRNDKFLFEKLSRKFPKDHDLIQYYVSNFAYGHTEVVYEEDEAKSCYLEWNKRKESITKILEDDVNKIILYAEKNNLSKEQVINFTKDGPSVILNMYLGNHISVESLRILDDHINIIDNWKEYSFISLWENDIRRIVKLKRFVKYDKNRVVPIIENFIESLGDL